MKLEVGMYVRTKKGGYIGKIYNINEFREPSMMYAIDIPKADDFIFMDKNDFKASHNIIDLIEVGDYVNGVMVTEIKDGKPFKEDYNDPYYSYYFDDIYSIVTKEQFESMEYKVC